MVFKLGNDKIDITPSQSMTMGGYGARKYPSDGTHDSLFARAAYFSDEGTELLLISCDLLAVGDELVHSIRDEITRCTNIPMENIMIAATHTHQGPAGVRNLLDEGYADQLKNKLAQISIQSQSNAVPCNIRIVQAFVDSISQNRRDPEGKIVDLLDLIVGVNESGAVALTLLAYACHPTILEFDNLKYSADFPGPALKLVEDNLGGMGMFIQGACGDINPTWSAHDFSNVDLNGKILGSAALSAAYRSLILDTERFAVNLSWGVDTPQKKSIGTLVSEIKLAAGQRLLELVRLRPENLDVEFADIDRLEMELSLDGSIENRRKIQPRLSELKASRHAWTTPGPRYQPGNDILEIHAFQFSKDLALIGLPGEFLVEVGEEIQRNSPYGHTIIVGYANGYFDYFPLAKDFSNHGYEVGRAIYGIGATEKIIDSASELLIGLYSS